MTRDSFEVAMRTTIRTRIRYSLGLLTSISAPAVATRYGAAGAEAMGSFIESWLTTVRHTPCALRDSVFIAAEELHQMVRPMLHSTHLRQMMNWRQGDRCWEY